MSRPAIIPTEGLIVTVTNSLTGKVVTGTTVWVSPTWQTVQIRLPDGSLTYAFPEAGWRP